MPEEMKDRGWHGRRGAMRMAPGLAKGSPEMIPGTTGPQAKTSSSPSMSLQLPTMQPGLLLVLTLLGMASALCPAPWRTMEVPTGMEEGSTWRFAVVKAWRTYRGAQRYCQDVYRGQLASVHSTATNEELRKLAATYSYWSFWIGAVTTCKDGLWKTSWEDLSPWNYANWATGQPYRLFTTCTVLSPRDGLWRSRPCFKLRPFICQY
ncbi:bone marrow proteoglycan isoform X2 [Numida meleagris]|uniref:bone marrow proteoglycan isoform X2 n=1 Tax=Numida meleagris TaxID=8996 RepID=UPI000B3E2EE9|nr:bone marrow proteoglycan isoform X2 [Numida meleagris]